MPAVDFTGAEQKAVFPVCVLGLLLFVKLYICCISAFFGRLFYPKAKLFETASGKRVLSAKVADPPGDYIYENMAYSKTSRIVRSTIVNSIVVGLLLATLGGISALRGVSLPPFVQWVTTL